MSDNHGARVNITDVTCLVNKILGGSNPNEEPVSYLACPDDHHPHMIDLGLPSGTKWACCNVDADRSETYGGFYAWGETEVKSAYNWDTYVHCDGSWKTCQDIGSESPKQSMTWLIRNGEMPGRCLLYCST